MSYSELEEKERESEFEECLTLGREISFFCERDREREKESIRERKRNILLILL